MQNKNATILFSIYQVKEYTSKPLLFHPVKTGRGLGLWFHYLRSILMRFTATIFFLFLLKFCFSQNNYSLQVVSSDKPKEFFTKKFSYKTHFKDSLQANTEVQDLFSKIRSSGYLASSIDSTVSDTLKTIIHILSMG